MTSHHVSVTTLLPEHADTYLELHAAVWPLVQEAIADHNIRNHSIHRHGDLLVRYYEYVGADHEADLASLGADPRLSEWNIVTARCQSPVAAAPAGEIWLDLPEVCYLP